MRRSRVPVAVRGSWLTYDQKGVRHVSLRALLLLACLALLTNPMTYTNISTIAVAVDDSIHIDANAHRVAVTHGRSAC